MSDTSGYETHAFVADFYDHILGYRNRPDVSFFVEAAKESHGPVLELGCGTGRILIPTARERIRITGLDFSSYMLGVCRNRLLEEAEDIRACVRLVEADMRNFHLNSRFTLATLPFRPFQHLKTVEDQCACLRSIHRHLRRKGRLILDLFNPWLKALVEDNIAQEQGSEPEFTMPDGRKVIRRYKFVSKDLFNQINQMEMIYYVTNPDGRTERLVHSFPMRYLFRYEAEHLLYRCGFRLLHVYADFDRSPYGSKYPGELILIAERQ